MLADEMLALLARERRYVLSGDFDRLARMVSQKTALMEECKGSLDDDCALRILSDLRRNADLLKASMAGIEFLKQSISTLRKEAGHLSAYGSDGRRIEHAAARPRHDQQV